MAKRYLVIGLGRFGAALAQALSQVGCDVVAVDADMNAVEAIKDHVALPVQLDATDPRALQSIECTTARAAVVAIGEDFAASVLCVAALREAGVERVIARSRGARESRILRAVGASEVIEIETEMGRTIGARLAAE